MDEIDCGSFFDHIDDLLDFPVEDVDGGAATLPSVAAAGNCNSLASIWPAESDSFPTSDSVFSGNTASDLSAELSVPVSFLNVALLLSIFVFLFKSFWRVHMNSVNCSVIISAPIVSLASFVAVGLLDYDITVSCTDLIVCFKCSLLPTWQLAPCMKFWFFSWGALLSDCLHFIIAKIFFLKLKKKLNLGDIAKIRNSKISRQ